MKRYTVKADWPHGLINEIEDANGKFVLYEDVRTLLRSMLYYGGCGNIMSAWVTDYDLRQVVPDPEFLKEIMK